MLVLNVLVVFWFNNLVLDGGFLTLGLRWANAKGGHEIRVADIEGEKMNKAEILYKMFPRRAECTVKYKGGGSGSNATGNGSLATGSTGSGSTNGGLVAKGPDEEKIKVILERTGYKLDVTTGQRKYGGPPPDWEGDPPASGCEVSSSFFYMRAC